MLVYLFTGWSLSAMSTFFSIGLSERLGNDNKLVKLNKLLDWPKIKSHLKGIHKNELNPQGGPKSYDVLKMFKSILLGQWHSLSDPGLEEALRLRLDFIAFTGFELEDIPDHTTLCRYRNKLISLGLYKTLFNEINTQLEHLGLKLEKATGAVIDATIIESSSRPKKVLEKVPVDRQEESSSVDYLSSTSSDPDATWLKKGKKSYYGYKGFIKTDDRDGYISSVHVTPANRSESKELNNIITSSDTRIYADKGYSSKGNRSLLRSKKIKTGLMYKGSKHKQLTRREKLFNKLVSKKRFIVERAFGTLKRQFLFSRSSYTTRSKVEGQMALKCICYNLLKALNMVKLA